MSNAVIFQLYLGIFFPCIEVNFTKENSLKATATIVRIQEKSALKTVLRDPCHFVFWIRIKLWIILYSIHFYFLYLLDSTLLSLSSCHSLYDSSGAVDSCRLQTKNMQLSSSRLKTAVVYKAPTWSGIFFQKKIQHYI